MANISRHAMLAGAAATVGASLFAGRAAASGRSINELGFVPIGGIEQWVGIQGLDDRNPIILFLHGGPGEAQSPFLKEFASWERAFTVVNWDQRGSGRTYGKNGPATPDMTVARMAEDAVEVAEYALEQLKEAKLVLVGHSWGALLGFSAVQRRPDLFYAFVGTGQPVNWTLSLEDRERWARGQAEAQGDAATIKELDATAALPVSDMKRVNASSKYRMSPADMQYLASERDFIGSPPFPTKGDVADWLAGQDFTGPKLWPAILSFDAREQFPSVPVPFFVIEGRDDHMISFEAAREYVGHVRAPIKAFIPIDGGHFACFTDSGEFIEALLRCVAPLINGTR